MGEKLEAIHRKQIRREPWPDFASFDTSLFAIEHRRRAAHEWARRARLEHASIHQFTELAHALATARAPLSLLGALSRLVADEVRHAELEWEMAITCYPEVLDEPDLFAWPEPESPWEPAPGIGRDGEVEALLAWAADAIVGACCIGESASVPTLEALAMVTTDPTCEAVFRQILRDEHLHATFGFEALDYLWSRLGDVSRDWLEAQLSRHLADFEHGVAEGLSLGDLVDRPLEIEPGDPARPNLGEMPRRHYALIFYSAVEHEILPRLAAVGVDARGAWAKRPGAAPAST